MINDKIDYTNLNVDATDDDIRRVCEEAIQYGFKAVCVLPEKLPLAVSLLKNSLVLPITVVDFPKGEGSIEQKRAEAISAQNSGAKEIDMVINYRAIQGGDYKEAFDGIKAVVDAISIPLKVILETSFLTHDEKVIGSALAKAAGASFVKTSTGFGTKATIEDVALLRLIVGPTMGVKASGGIKSLEAAKSMIESGANRLGTSAKIVNDYKN